MIIKRGGRLFEIHYMNDTRAQHKGYLIGLCEDGSFYFLDDMTNIDDDPRPCAICLQWPTEKGHDPCISDLDGVKFACCGHGFTYDAYVTFFDERERLYCEKAISFFNSLGRGPRDPFC